MTIKVKAVALAAAISIAASQAPMIARAADAAASSDAAEAAALRTEIEELDQRLKVLERKQEITKDDATAAAAVAPVVRAGGDRFSLSNTKGDTTLRFRAILNVDNRIYTNDLAPTGAALAPGSNTFLIRQARPYIEGTLGGLVDFRLMPDFAGGKTVIQDAYGTAKFKPWFQVTVGKFKSPVGLERLQSDQDLRFNERALPDRLIPNRDLGLQFSGDLAGGLVTYQAAVLDGAPDGGSVDGNTSPDTDNNDDKEAAVRLFALPFRDSQLFKLRGLGVGIGASEGHAHGQLDATGAATNSFLAAFRTNGQQTFFSYRGGTTPTVAWGDRQRISPQAYYYYGPFGVLTEYVQEKQDVRRTIGTTVREDTLTHDAWQVQLSWFLTGEDAGYRAPNPRRPYAPGASGWGAFELAARIAQLDIDSDAFTGGANSFANPVGSASKARAWTVGANWYLTQNFKLLFDYEQTEFTGGAAAGADAPSEKVFISRFQVQY